MPLAHAKGKPAPDIAGLRADQDMRCVAPLMRALMDQAKGVEPAKSDLAPLYDRLSAFVPEVGNDMIARYHVTIADMERVSKEDQAAANDAFAKDSKLAIVEMVEPCLTRLTAREVVRPVPTPGSCSALHGISITSPITKSDIGNPTVLATSMMPSMLDWMKWRNWAKKQLLAAGMSDAQATKAIAAERVALEAQEKRAAKGEYFVVRDLFGCNALMKATLPRPIPKP